MKPPLIICFLFSAISISFGQSQIPVKTDSQREPIFFIGLRPGFNFHGIGREIKYNMSADGLSGNGQFFGEDYPRTYLSGVVMGEFEYRRKPFGIGLEGGLSANGSTKGVTGTEEFLIIFSKNRYLTLKHRVNTVSPFLRLYTEQFSLQLGASWNHWRIQADSTADFRKYTGNTYGAVAGISIKIHDNGATRIALIGQFRYLGSQKVGSFISIDDHGNEIELFKERRITLSHAVVGLSIDVGMIPKKLRK